MRLLLRTGVASLVLMTCTAAWACGGDHSAPPSPPAERYSPQAQPVGDTLAANVPLRELVKIGGAGLGGVMLAGSIFWSMRRRQA